MSEPFWVPLGGSGAVDYKGDWAAGTQYQPGDVVRQNGVDYLAVNPSLGTEPFPVAPGGLVGCRLGKSVIQNVTAVTWTLITWDIEDVDTHGFHAPANPGRITIPPGFGGTYQLICSFAYQQAAPGNTPNDGAGMAVLKNGTGDGTFDGTPVGADDSRGYNTGYGNVLLGVTDFLPLAAGDVLRTWFHSEGTTPAVRTGSAFSVRRVGP